jgi:MoxR-like ATPase
MSMDENRRLALSSSLDIVRMNKIHLSLVELFNEMSKRLIERDQLNRLIGLTFFCKSNCFLIGDRGVGKSYAIEKLGDSIEGTKPLWQLMLKKDTKIEEVFGRTYQDEKGAWLINTKNSLLEADNIFADEMFKAQGEILSGLLEVLVDRSYTFGDGKKRKTDIIAFFGASNEYPTERFMLPYVDRFDIWIEVKPIQSKFNRKKYYLDDYTKEVLESKFISKDDIEFVYNQEADKVFFNETLIDLYIEITTSFINSEIKTSDRKYRRIIRLIKTIAYLNNRTEVNYSDLFILLYSAWQNEIEKERVERDLYDLIFGKKEKINAYLSTLSSDFNDLLNGFNSELYKYYTHKYEFIGESQDKAYTSTLDRFNNVIKRLDSIYSGLEEIEQLYKFNMFVQKQLDANIIIVGIKSEVFSEELIKSFRKLGTEIKERKRELMEWINTNKDLYNYKSIQQKDFLHK